MDIFFLERDYKWAIDQYNELLRDYREKLVAMCDAYEEAEMNHTERMIGFAQVLAVHEQESHTELGSVRFLLVPERFRNRPRSHSDLAPVVRSPLGRSPAPFLALNGALVFYV